VLSEEIDTSGGEQHLVVLAQKVQNKLVGLYLYGSLTTNGFDPLRSDVDLLAVLSSDLTEPELNRLLAVHSDLVHHNPAWDDRIEVVYVPVPALKRSGPQGFPWPW